MPPWKALVLAVKFLSCNLLTFLSTTASCAFNFENCTFLFMVERWQKAIWLLGVVIRTQQFLSVYYHPTKKEYIQKNARIEYLICPRPSKTLNCVTDSSTTQLLFVFSVS